MRPGPDASGPHDHDAPYRGVERLWSGQVNAALVAEVGDLGPCPGHDRALDVGAGEGADAVWLRSRGWQVTAVEPSAVAVDRARAAAGRAAAEIDWQVATLLDAALAPEGYALVCASYPALPREPEGANLEALLGAVAPGGTLLVVHHADADRQRARAHGHDPDHYLSVEAVRAALGEGWQVVTDEVRERQVEGGAGAHHRLDRVIRARRRTT